MRTPPADLSEDDVRDHLARHYGTAGAHLEFVPRGDVGWSWVARTGTGEPLFLKVYGSGDAALLARVRRSAALLDLLTGEGWLANVPRPVPGTGGATDLPIGTDGLVATVQTYVPGTPLGGERMTAGVAAQIGVTAARLQASTAAVTAAGIELEAHPVAPDGGGLLGFLDARRDDLLREAPEAEARLDAVRNRLATVAADAAAAAAGAPRVLVHGDMGHDNVLVDGFGELGGAGRASVVDWDDARLAPAENELAMSAWLAPDVFADLARSYVETRTALGHPLDGLAPALMEWQAWSYNIGSIWFYLERLRDEALAAEQAASDRQLLRWCVTEWDTTPARFEAAAAALAAAGAPVG